jgi:probable rRNA maturation factor
MGEGLEVEFDCAAPRWSDLLEHLEETANTALQVAAKHEGVSGVVSLLFTDDAAIQLLNARWRDQDKPTNVLSFPADARAKPLLGDLALALETIEREAAEQGKKVHDHTVHLLVHGFLHLIGYDHIQNEDAEVMEARECEILRELSIADPYTLHV